MFGYKNSQSKRDIKELHNDYDQILEDLNHASSNIKKFCGNRYSESVEKVGEYTASKPLHTIGAALLIGFLAGFILKK